MIFTFAESKDSEKSKVINDGPVPWCKEDQLTFVSEQVSHHPPSEIFHFPFSSIVQS
jgi:hypothetical protein